MGLWSYQLMVPPLQINKNHVIPDAASDQLRRAVGAAQAAVRTDVVVLLAHDEHGLTEQRDPHRVPAPRNRGHEIDEVPPGTVGRGHLTPETRVVRRRCHASKTDVVLVGAPLEAAGQLMSAGVAGVGPFTGATGQLMSAGVTAGPREAAAGQLRSAGTIAGPCAPAAGQLMSAGVTAGPCAPTAGQLMSAGTIAGPCAPAAGQLMSAGTAWCAFVPAYPDVAFAAAGASPDPKPEAATVPNANGIANAAASIERSNLFFIVGFVLT
ncbi:hypothetical protein JFN87_00660 [Streptomyces bomunensis]|uniref:Uncharacterized protein n=1 Tax=Streptomyces montanisoli TaxID=2798581 RepID=A0A940M7V0_9ACTN|nr:hypothetical protein [Streptomyces montanisoli]